jgi:transcription-repair coupling factor (superfamily II helicase)
MTDPFHTHLFADVFDAIEQKEKRIKINGLWGSSEAFFLSRLCLKGIPFCLVTPSSAQAEQMHQEISFFSASIRAPLLLSGERAANRADWTATRLSILYQLASGSPISIVTSVEGFLQKVVDKSFLLEQSETLKKGDTVERDVLIERLDQKNYERVDCVTQPGEFASRGGIIDLYSPIQPAVGVPTGIGVPTAVGVPTHPVRIELLGDTIASMRLFDPVTQKSIEMIDAVLIIPGREDLSNPNYVRSLLSDYLPLSTLLIYDEPDAVTLQGRDNATPSPSERSKAAVLGSAAPATHLLKAGENRTVIDLESLSISSSRGAKRFMFEIPSLASLGLERFGQSFAEVIERLNQLRSDHLIVVVVRNQIQIERFKRIFNDYDVPYMDMACGSLLSAPLYPPTLTSPAGLVIATGNIAEGFLLPESKIVFLTDEVLSGHLGRKKDHSKDPADSKSLLMASLDDLKPEDYVVHVEHGIGQYMGLKRISVSLGWGSEQYETDFLMLRYGGGNNLYVPLYSLKLVSKYIGPEGAHPPLDQLGSGRWAKAKEKVKKSIQEMTGELLTLYAERKIVEGHPFRSTPHIEEFAAGFEYEETPDQLRAVEEIIADMQQPKPMDRLICGDVGYGKTEVAMRGAFLAVMDNKQVAVAVPTTLLALQHGETFTKRFAPFPVRVATLSRLSTHKEQAKVIADIKKGAVDIVIGTHRLFQKDMVFHDLGLVIIDEEHRFGVRHKEKLKKLRKEVDILTLTATPIPRTLQMALAQTRDMTVIATPPVNRLAIRTVLAPFDSKLIREVIFRERVRGGQVFFVHNRVHDIEQIGMFLKNLVPEAKVVIAHGQMREGMLTDVISAFIAKKYDILLTTTIIESGLDIPSANTIIINHADKFGLAELYQLRGRVGRSGEQAYAYLLVEEEKVLTEMAQRRLQTLLEFTELGDGFRIAARDLEIRGAGNLLGAEQSGQIAAIGFDLYLKMIDETVHELKGMPIKKEIEPELQLKCSSFIPEEYVPDAYQRLTLYRRLASVSTASDVDRIHEETLDRYGPMPHVAKNLFNTVKLKRQAAACHVIKIIQEEHGVIFHLHESASVGESGYHRLLGAFQNRIRLLSSFVFELSATPLTGKPNRKALLRAASTGVQDEALFLEASQCLMVLMGK